MSSIERVQRERPEGAPGDADDQPLDLASNSNRFSGFSDLYDSVRPQPPAELSQILISYCCRPEPDVVDLGSGTGLSTRWAAGWASSVVGVEPSADMRAIAEESPLANVRFVDAFAHETGLASASADVVLAVQSLHWMEPSVTLAEIARLLRPSGVFAAVDCDWPPTVGSAELERAWAETRKTIRVLETRLARGVPADDLHGPVLADDPAARGYSARDAHKDRVLALGQKSWSKDYHLERMSSSGLFAWCHELALHRAEEGDAERFVGLFRSQGDYQTLRRNGFEDEELGMPVLEEIAHRVLGTNRRPWWFTYRVRVGVLRVG